MLWGVDLGGTKIEICVLESNDARSTIIRERVHTPQTDGYDAILSAIASLVKQTSDKLGVNPTKIGFGTPGVLDPITQNLKNSNTQCLNGKPLLADLRKLLGCDIRIANDANCSALAEATMGAGKGAKVVFGVILGTGVGGGVVINGEVLHGRQGVAGEWGHNVLEFGGKPCYCGKSGCVEMCISGPALEEYFFKKSGEALPLNEIVARARAGKDLVAIETIERLIDLFGRAIAVVINIVDPDLIVLAGGVSNIDELYTKGVESAKKSVFNPTPDIQIVKNLLGDSAGVFGAACLFKI